MSPGNPYAKAARLVEVLLKDLSSCVLLCDTSKSDPQIAYLVKTLELPKAPKVVLLKAVWLLLAKL